nr:2-acylglycerol O-acyltransferase 3 isoform X4 [Manis javanica]
MLASSSRLHRGLQVFAILQWIFFLGLGLVSSDKASAAYLLSRPRGGQVAVLAVGGPLEALETKPGALSLRIRTQKGFIKLALEHGASLVPVFSFGENELFQQFPNPPGSWVRRAQEVMPPLPSVALPLFHGRRGLLLPFRTPIHTVGEPRLCPRAIPQVPHSPRLAFGCNPSPQLCPHDQCRPEGTGPTSQPPPLSSLFCPQWGPRSRCSGTCGPTGRR